VSRLSTSTFQALGATPISLNLQIAKFYEVQEYCAMTNHMWDGLLNPMNGKAWRARPADLQAVLTNYMNRRH